MSLREAAKALVESWDRDPQGPWPELEALREALAEAPKAEAEKAEPVAWMHNQRVDCIHNEVKELLQRAGGHLLRPLDKTENYTIPLYAHPPAVLPESVETPNDVPYRHVPPKEVTSTTATFQLTGKMLPRELAAEAELSDEEILALFQGICPWLWFNNDVLAFARAVLAAAREKDESIPRVGPTGR
jgi:hypothetical protein